MYTKNDGFGDETLRAAWQELAAEAARQAARDRPWLLKLLARGGAACGRVLPLTARYAFWKERLRRLRPGQRRTLQRRLGVSLAGAALLLALAAAPGAAAPGATITVDQTSGAIAVDGACSLAEAIDNANGDSQYSAAPDECAAGSGADTIYLDTDVTLTASNNSTFGPTGLPVVTSQITIEGQGNTVSRDIGAPNFRILAVDLGNLTLNSVTVSGGLATGFDLVPQPKGGGIWGLGGVLTVTNSTISGNSAAFSGGGIHCQGMALTVSNSTLSGNTGGLGAGIYAVFNTVAVSNSTLSGNKGGSGGSGGGIFILNATVTVSNSTLSGNSIGTGGGITARNGASLVVMNSTLSGNSAVDGGGIRVSVSGTVTVLNSIVAAQSAGADCSNDGTLTSGGYNIDSDSTCGFTLASDQQSVSSGSLNLKPLANTGGPTETHALGFNSVALDQIPSGTNGCGDVGQTDQRGITRPQDWGAVDVPQKCDVGAWEGQPNQDPNAVTLAGLRASPASAPAGWWAAVLAGLGGLGGLSLGAFFARRRGWRGRGSGPSASAPLLSAPFTRETMAAPDASMPGYTLPAISSRGQLKHFAGSPLVVDPLALPEP